MGLEEEAPEGQEMFGAGMMVTSEYQLYQEWTLRTHIYLIYVPCVRSIQYRARARSLSLLCILSSPHTCLITFILFLIAIVARLEIPHTLPYNKRVNEK